VWSHAGGGTAAAIEAARFRIEDIDRFSYAPLRFFLKHTHILGRGRPVPAADARCTRARITLPGCSFR